MKVTIYTITDCPFCKAEKDYLKGRGVAFEEKNLESNKGYLPEMLEASDKFAGVPFTVIVKDDGITVKLRGFTKEEFDEALMPGINPQASIPKTPLSQTDMGQSPTSVLPPQAQDSFSAPSPSSPSPLTPNFASPSNQSVNSPSVNSDLGISPNPVVSSSNNPTNTSTTNPATLTTDTPIAPSMPTDSNMTPSSVSNVGTNQANQQLDSLLASLRSQSGSNQGAPANPMTSQGANTNNPTETIQTPPTDTTVTNQTSGSNI